MKIEPLVPDFVSFRDYPYWIMKHMMAVNIQLIKSLLLFLISIWITMPAEAQAVSLQTGSFKNDPAVSVTDYKGKKALRFSDLNKTGGGIAILNDVRFTNGTIEVDLAGSVLPNFDTTFRGFIGIAFRVQDENKYECFYIRPTNGRSNDQLRRNHSTQYISHPDYPWFRLRNESPGVYESYTDLEDGEWTTIKIQVNGKSAKFFVNGAEQPCLIVNDLKLPDTTGGVALWIGPGTDGYFRNLKVKNEF